MINYAELQVHVVNQLRELGIWFEYEDRIASFWLCNNLKFVAPPGVDVSNVIKDLQTLTIMRRDGKEPQHAGGKYIDLRGTSTSIQREITKA